MTPENLSWVEARQPQLVRWAEDYVQTTKLYERHNPKKRNPRVSGSQLRNLLNAATQGSSLAVLVNFLRYQIGRDKRGWPHEESGTALADLLGERLKSLCAERMGGSHATPAGADPAEVQIEFEAQMAARLLGYVIREYTYRCKLANTNPKS